MENFLKEWKTRGNEKSDSHQFWDSMLRTFWKIENPNEIMRFEVPVQLENSTGFIDVWIPKTRVIIEQKSRGRKLDKIEKQSDGSMLNPFQQAKRYDDHRKTSEKARWIVTCNFDEICIYNLEADRPELHGKKIKLEELPERFGELDFLVDENQSESLTAEYVSASAGSLVQNFRDLFFDSISEMNQTEIESLNKLCIRCVFCMYAEDSGIFERKIFLNYLKDLREKSLPEFKRDLSNLFWRLNTKDLPRGIDPRLLKFPYVNGSLFDGESLEILDRLDGSFDLRGMIESLIDAAEKNIWSKISPTIFGSIFESIMNPETRRSGGVHFTSEKNIHRVIDPLFLDNLNDEFNHGDLSILHDKIASLKFLDPACGSGNFLTETYISLRKLENRIIEKIGGSIRVTIENFFGIEINDFAVQVAKLALWISEHQMDGGDHFLPLTRETHIVESNSLQIDWRSVVESADFIMGNPPYAGRRFRTEEQKREVAQFFSYKDVNYVACWIWKATDYMFLNSKTESAFVAADSICQGEQVFPIWNSLFKLGIKINFAWTTFKWENETADRKNMAQVNCIIAGLSFHERSQKLLDGVEVQNINGYLLDAPDVCVSSKSKPICKVPRMRNGNIPLDGDALKIEEEDYPQFEQYSRFVKKLVGARELLYNEKRYVLWLVDADPHEIRSIKPIYDRVKLCRKNRLAMNDRASQKLAESPMTFRDTFNPDSYIALPMLSAGTRKYIPMAYLNHEFIPTNRVQIIPNATLELFGILSSKVHMAWTRVVTGYFGTSYQYSQQIVYNNFPFPSHNDRIEITAQKILDARSNHPNSSLAELYDPNLMPSDLRRAHEENDRAVLDAYNFPRNITESEIVARLFELYQKLTSE